MEDDILETLFEKREDTGAFNFECIEYHQLLNKRKNKKIRWIIIFLNVCIQNLKVN